MNKILKLIKYCYTIVILSILTVLPQIILSPTLKHALLVSYVGIIIFFSYSLNKYLFKLLVLFVNIQNIFIVHVALHWGYEGSLIDRMGVARLSPSYEIFEYLQSFISLYDIFYIFFVFILIFYSFKLDIVCFKINQFKFKLFLWIIFILMLFLPKKYLFRSEPFGIYYEYKIVRTSTDYILKRSQYIQYDKIHKNNRNLIYDTIVIVLGESVDRNRMSLYGANRKTTPFLDNLKHKNYFYKFIAIAPANQTMFAVPMEFSPSSVKIFYNLFMKHKSIVGVCGDLGYTIYWISNQGKIGIYEDAISSYCL